MALNSEVVGLRRINDGYNMKQKNDSIKKRVWELTTNFVRI